MLHLQRFNVSTNRYDWQGVIVVITKGFDGNHERPCLRDHQRTFGVRGRFDCREPVESTCRTWAMQHWRAALPEAGDLPSSPLTID